MASTYQLFKDLEKQINAVSELKTNEAVQQSLGEMDKAFKKDDKYFDQAAELITSIGKAIPKFTSSSSNGADIASGVLDIASALVKAAGMIPGAKAFTAPISIVLKLVGSIVGSFGTSKKSRYYNALNEMIKSAVDNLNSELTQQNIDGAISKMKSHHELVADLLSQTHTDPASLLSKFPDITVRMFREEAEDVLGSSFSNIARNVPSGKHGNWRNAADTFYSVSELIGFKMLYLLEGITYFLLIEKDDKEQTRTMGMYEGLAAFKSTYQKEGASYLSRPTIAAAGITQWLYRMSTQKFTFLFKVYDCLSDGTATYFPTATNQFRFQCKIYADHDVSKKQPCECVRLSTLSAHSEGGKNRVLEIPKDGTQGTTTAKKAADHVSTASPDFHYNDPANRSHFELKSTAGANGDNPPFTRWDLVGRNKFKEMILFPPSHIATPVISELRQKDIFIFEVFPTKTEIDNQNNSLFPNQWTNRPDGKRSMLIIGSANEDNIWCDHNGKDFEKANFYDVVYNKKRYGNPEQCLFYFLSESEK